MGSAGVDALSVGAAVLEALCALMGDRVLLILIDDVQWLDEPSAQALAYAFRRLGDDGVVVLMTARDDPGAPVPSAIARAVEGPRGRTVVLGGLDAAGVAEMAAQRGVDLDVAEVRVLTDHTEGNPLWIGAALDDRPTSAFRRPGLVPMPPPKAFAALLSARVARLSAEARAMAEAIAVAGPRSSVRSAAEIVGVTDPIDAIDDLVSSGVFVVATESPSRPSFAHPMIRSAVYHRMPPGRRAALHGAVAARSPDRWTRLRHLAAAAVDPDEGLAVALVELADAERSDSPARAAAAYELAATMVDDPVRRDDLLLRALRQRVAGGLVDRGIAVAAKLSEGVTRSTRRTAIEGSLANFRGDLAVARALLLDAWSSLEAGGPLAPEDLDLRGTIASDLAAVALNQGHIADADRWARTALEAAGDRADLTVPSRLVLVMALGGSGERAASIRSLLGEDGVSTGGLGMVELWNGDPVEAAGLLRVAGESREAELNFMVRMGAALFLCEAAYRSDEWEESVRLGELSASNLEDAGIPWLTPLAHANAALPLVALGRLDDAADHVERATRLTPGVSRLWAVTAAALLAAARGDLPEVADLTMSVAADDDAAGLVNPGLKPWRCIGAEALAALGEIEAAERMVDPVGRWVAERPTPTTTVQHARARLAIAVARGDRDDAEAWFGAGIGSARACPSGYEVAQLELLHGAHLRRLGQRNRAASLLGRAHRTFSRLRAVSWVERVEREQAAGGLAPTRRGGELSRSLTPTELVVARLVAQGRTNKEVAGELVVSPKTVEFHLGSIYRKLGVRNRVELASHLLGTPDPRSAKT